MDKDKNAVDEFLGNLENKQDESSFQDNTQDAFGETIEAKEVEDKEEKPLPFNKDPKIQKFIEKELDKRLKDYKGPEEKAQAGTEDSFKEAMDAFTAAIGNDTPEKVSALTALQKALSGLDQRASEKAIAHIEQIQAKQIEADKKADEELSNGFESVEEQFEITFTKEKKKQFAEFLEKVAPKDENGEIIAYPDFIATYETFEKLNKLSQPPNRAKELASRSMARSSETGSQQIRKANTSSFESTDNFLESLGR